MYIYQTGNGTEIKIGLPYIRKAEIKKRSHRTREMSIFRGWLCGFGPPTEMNYSEREESRTYK